MINQRRSSDVRIARIAIGITVALLAAFTYFIIAHRFLLTRVGQAVLYDHTLAAGQNGILDFPATQCFDTRAHFDAFERALVHRDKRAQEQLRSSFQYIWDGARLHALDVRADRPFDVMGDPPIEVTYVRIGSGDSRGRKCWMIDSTFFKDVRP